MSVSKLLLHPLHVASGADSAPEPLIPYKLREINCGDSLSSFVKSNAALHGDFFVADAPHVYLGNKGMQILTSSPFKGEKAAEWSCISLSSCEVIQVEAAQQQLIALGRRENVAKHVEPRRAPRRLTLPFSEVWVLMVDGDEAALHSVLNTMSSLGAVRSDFQSFYDMDERPIGSGSCSNVFVAKRSRKCKQSMFPTIADGSEQIVTKVFVKGDHRRDASEVASSEADLLVAVQNHPNIIRFYGLFTIPDVVDMDPPRWVLAMEWCCRGDLHDDVARVGAYNDTRAAAIMVGTLSALAHIHSRGIVHRDVKADNIFLGVKGRPVLSDFGIAAREDDATAMTERCGTPGYAAPEVLSKSSSVTYCNKVDVFGAGVVLYFIMSGSLPFAGFDIARVLRRTHKCRVKFTAESFMRVSPWMKQFILLLLQKDVAYRPSARNALCSVWTRWSSDLQDVEWLRGRECQMLAETLGAFPILAPNTQVCDAATYLTSSTKCESHEADFCSHSISTPTYFSHASSGDRTSLGSGTLSCISQDESIDFLQMESPLQSPRVERKGARPLPGLLTESKPVLQSQGCDRSLHSRRARSTPASADNAMAHTGKHGKHGGKMLAEDAEQPSAEWLSEGQSQSSTRLLSEEAERPSSERLSGEQLQRLALSGQSAFREQFLTRSSSRSRPGSTSPKKNLHPWNSETSCSSKDEPTRPSFQLDVLAEEPTSDSAIAESEANRQVHHSI